MYSYTTAHSLATPLTLNPRSLPEKTIPCPPSLPSFLSSLPLLQRGIYSIPASLASRSSLPSSFVVVFFAFRVFLFCSSLLFFGSWSCVLTAAATQPPSRGRSKGGASGSDGQGGATHQLQDWSVILAAGGAPPWRNYCAGCTRRHMSPKRQRPSRKLLQTSSIFSTCDHTPTRIQI